MKHNPFIPFIVCAMTFFILAPAQAEWSASIQATGQKINGHYKSQITIGAGLNSMKIKAPPKAPMYSCTLGLIDLPDWSGYLTTHIQPELNMIHMWALAVNPHGNVGGFDETTTTLSWNPSQLGDGIFKLVEGWDGTGKVLIHNMKNKSSFDVKGFNADLYFTIIQETEPQEN